MPDTPDERPASEGDSPGVVPGPLTVVAIGASAGGLTALKRFFEPVPGDTGLAFVVVVHLSPDHESHLADLLQPRVRMPVVQVTETTPLQANHVYVIPPGCNLSAVDTHLRLSDLEERRSDRAPIDHFLRTLADTHDGRSVAVVLTGTGSDGTLGIGEIKQRDGLTVVQDPTDAEYDGMPQSAIATGLVDLVLPLTEIPGAVLRYTRTRPRLPLPPATLPVHADVSVEGEERDLLLQILSHLHARTGRDFARYKRATVLRRIARRMQLAQIEAFAAYADFLREQPAETAALADDLLITVTHFFRDPEVFAVLAERVVPALFEGRGPDDVVRVWSVGCATGEEAYSLAMLLLEEAARHESPPRLQVFASDLHEPSLARARDGFYPGDITVDVSAARLARFFQPEDGGYRVRKEVRELVVFAPHNLLSDPPFSRIDVVSCRNVLIYLQRDVQREVMELFHYALAPGGALVLGTSETVEGKDLFEVEDKAHCLYRRRDVAPRELRVPAFPLVAVPLKERAGAPVASTTTGYGALHQRMVEAYAPPSLLLSADDRVVHLSEHAGRYLALPGGELTSSAFRLVRDELRADLRSTVHAARQRDEAVRSRPVRVRLGGETRSVVLDVRPALAPHPSGFALVIFDERPAARAGDAGASGHATVAELEAERDLAQQRLQALADAYETGQEDMRAANEELQSANEELRSTMEELETSKEELQSINEELQTVNQENRHKVEELGQLSGDLQNLLAATDIATLFLDRSLRILRFTPQVGELFNVRLADRGRPLSDLTHRLGYNDLLDDARRVLARLAPVEREVQDEAGRWYLARVLPYRTPEDRIEGVVLTFIDITARVRAEESVRAEGARAAYRTALADALRLLGDPAAVQEEAARVLGERLGGAVVETVALDGAGDPLGAYGARLAAEVRAGRTVVVDDPSADARLRPAERAALAARGVGAFGLVPLGGADAPEAVLVVHCPTAHAWTAGEQADLDETAARTWAAVERTRAEAALRASEERFRLVAEAVPDVLFTASADGRVDYVSSHLTALTGVEPRAVVGSALWPELVHPDDRERAVDAWEEAQQARERYQIRYRLRADSGGYCWVIVRAQPSGDGAALHWYGTITDVDALTRAEHAVQALNETLEQRVEERTARVRELSLRLVNAEQEERQRIAHVLHDDLQQHLAGLRILLQVLHTAPSEADREALHDRIGEILEATMTLTRSLATEMSPPALANSDIGELLRWIADRKRALLRLEVDVEADARCEVPDEAARTVLYQVLREALLNVAKHAGTPRATIRCRRDGPNVVAEVVDDGTGFDPATVGRAGFGLFSVRERLAGLGGHLHVDSAPGQGTTVTFTIPAVRTPAPPRADAP